MRKCARRNDELQLHKWTFICLQKNVVMRITRRIVEIQINKAVRPKYAREIREINRERGCESYRNSEVRPVRRNRIGKDPLQTCNVYIEVVIGDQCRYQLLVHSVPACKACLFDSLMLTTDCVARARTATTTRRPSVRSRVRTNYWWLAQTRETRGWSHGDINYLRT